MYVNTYLAHLDHVSYVITNYLLCNTIHVTMRSTYYGMYGQQTGLNGVDTSCLMFIIIR